MGITAQIRMHSSRMRIARSLTVSCCILHNPPGNHACPPLQPCMPPTTMHTPHNHIPPQPRTSPSNHTCPWQPCMPPSNHACPPATTHAPQQPCTPPTTMQPPQQPCTPPSNHTCPPHNHTPPLWTEFLTHTSENITLPQTFFVGSKYASNFKFPIITQYGYNT